jgi:type IV secretion system protein VirB10
MTDERDAPMVERRGESPPGSVPKNRQTWIMVAIAVVIVLAVVFSGSTAPAQKGTAPMPAAVNAPTKAEIDRYTQALRSEELRLRQAQADASRSRDAFQQQVAASGMQGGIPGQGATGPNGEPLYPAAAGAPAQRHKSAIEEDREKREYASVFASNIALSYRRPAEGNPGKADSAPADAAASEPPREPGTVPAEAGRQGSEAKAPRKDDKPAPSAVSVPAGHTLFEGTIIEAVLTNRLEGSFAGPVNCQVTSDVYSHDRQTLLIPRGSRVLGEARRVQEQDQQRLAVVFHRLIMPDGYSVDLDRMPGLDQAGATGLKDKVNRHVLSTLGTSVALGLLAGFSMYGTGSAFTADGADVYRQGVAGQLGRDSTRILDRQLNRMPSVTIREGTRVRILLAGDISLPAWHNHPPTPGL